MILVTGATGFIGTVLMKALAEREMPAKPFQGRINNPYHIRDHLNEVDTIIHLAGVEAHGRARTLQHIDVEGTMRLVEACRGANIRRFILISRLGADSHAMFPLLRAKGEQEEIVRKSNLPYTIIRSATLFGRHDRFLNHIVGLAHWTWPFIWLPGGGQTVMQPLWVEDLVRCILLALARYDLVGKTISVAGEERLKYEEIVRESLWSAGISAPILFRPSLLLVRPISQLFFGWRFHPPVTLFWLDRFTVPDITDLDSIRYHFNFHPASFRQHCAYLRQPGLRWQILGL